MIENVSKPRNKNLDILRILACFFVVLAHVSSVYLDTLSVPTVGWVISHFYSSIGHMGTILFFFISGSLLLSETYHFIPRRFYTHNVLSLFVAYYAWIVIYHLIGFIQRGNWGWVYVKDVIINVIQGKAGYHFWYVPMLLGIYFILPMLRAICKGGRGLAVYFVVLFLVVQIGFDTIQFFEFPHKYLLESLMERIPFTLVNHHVGYFVMGYVLMSLLKEQRFPKGFRGYSLLLTCGGIFLGILGDVIVSAQQGTNSIAFLSLFSLTLCVSTAGFFVFINGAQLHLSERLGNVITKVAGLTFGIYMMHPLILDWVREIPFVEVLPCAIEIPISTVIAFGICAVVTYLLSFIPVIKKWVLFMG